jgi:hypothetical protein
LIKAAFVLVVMTGCLQALAQEKKGKPADADFHYYIANETRIGDSKIEFDLLLLNTNPTLVFELGTVQAGILINPAIINEGTVLASIVPGSSTLNMYQAPSVITFNQRKNCIKLAAKTPPGIGSGTIVSTDPANPTKVCRVRLTNSKPWLTGDSDLKFSFTTKPYPTKISKYDPETRLNTAMEVNPFNCYTLKNKDTKTVMTETGDKVSQEINIYPNPNKGIFSVSYTTATPATYEIRITNTAGSLVYKKTDIRIETNFNQEIVLNDLPDGNYTLTLISDKTQISRKFIVKK